MPSLQVAPSSQGHRALFLAHPKGGGTQHTPGLPGCLQGRSPASLSHTRAGDTSRTTQLQYTLNTQSACCVAKGQPPTATQQGCDVIKHKHCINAKASKKAVGLPSPRETWCPDVDWQHLDSLPHNRKGQGPPVISHLFWCGVHSALPRPASCPNTVHHPSIDLPLTQQHSRHAPASPPPRHAPACFQPPAVFAVACSHAGATSNTCTTTRCLGVRSSTWNSTPGPGVCLLSPAPFASTAN
jgi:hypothetical protein